MRRWLGIGVWVLTAGAVLALYALAPHLVSDFHSRDLAQAGVFFIAIVGLNILTGYTGQISLGHGALMAVGGYTTAALAVILGVLLVKPTGLFGRAEVVRV